MSAILDATIPSRWKHAASTVKPTSFVLMAVDLDAEDDDVEGVSWSTLWKGLSLAEANELRDTFDALPGRIRMGVFPANTFSGTF